MKNNVAIATAALLGTALAAPQGSAPKESAPDGCSKSYDGEFELRIIAAVDKRDIGIMRRQTDDDPQAGAADFTVKLEDGVLKDSDGRTGNIVANHQFQFDKPIQDNAIYTSGFSVCDNRYLALGDSTTFYKCESGEFANLYDEEIGEHCQSISFTVNPVNGGGDSSGGEGASQIPDGQPQAPTGTAPEEPVSQIPDGQPQAPTGEAPEGEPIAQIPDGQPQAPTDAAPEGEPVSQIPDGQPQAPTGAAPEGEPVSQIPDGQPQAPTGAAPEGEPVSQIPDGQPQAPTGAAPEGEPVSQIPDGQPQAPTGAAPEGEPVSQIPDGQPQAPTGAAPEGEPVSQIPDGQPQAPTEAAAPEGEPISQIPDGQPQAPTGAAPNGTVPETDQVDASAGSKIVPGTIIAVAIGALGFAIAL